MTAEKPLSTEIKTIEEYSLYSLDRSVEGLEHMKEDALACCSSMEKDAIEPACRRLVELTTNLYSFDTFEKEMCELFAMDTNRIEDQKGSLAEAETNFRSSMIELGNMIETRSFKLIPEMIRSRLVPFLDRFQELIPAIKLHIATEFADA